MPNEEIPDAEQQFDKALANPAYMARGKTLMARGLCQSAAGKYDEAEQSLLKSYQLDARQSSGQLSLGLVVCFAVTSSPGAVLHPPPQQRCASEL